MSTPFDATTIGEVMTERRSIRRFKPDPLPRQLLLELIDAATMAPSATNRQAWRFIIVSDPQLRARLMAAGASTLIEQAPGGILVTYDNRTLNTAYHDDYQSAAAAIQNLLLAAAARGLGACWLCTLPHPACLRSILSIPRTFSPIAYVILGYPSATAMATVPRRQPVEAIVGENLFPLISAEDRQWPLRLFWQRCLLQCYYRLPAWLKRRWINRLVHTRYVKTFSN